MTPLLIRHTTHYAYSSPVALGRHRLLLRPRVGHDIRINSSSLTISPQPTKITWARDVDSNSVAYVTFGPELATELRIESQVHVEHYDDKPLDFLVEDRAVMYPFVFTAAERVELSPYLVPVFNADQTTVGTWVEEFLTPGNTIETYVLLDLINRAIATTFTYRAREEPGVQRPGETLEKRSGSCRDFATLMIEACRHLGLPARFVSGYASTEDIPAAMGATHAWTEVFLPGAGWKGFDSTSGTVTGTNHIAVAVGRNPESFPPVSGSFAADDDNVSSKLKVDVSVTRDR
ncbi:transglutaminase family protein [Synoicihabitans lomoniglobus]|uniref:Transglutaminase family protein n=1 Tax=Synoicihabitans lomoniglobus TaxID=2909285 RepID=A0AAF0I7X7_9BACT|nr:transglutaminase family protein [Opitutaceae bacterium LMO-M01]WED67111.1 transglutaminase family protein [Opitutaceae bacterium LMO-M01]